MDFFPGWGAVRSMKSLKFLIYKSHILKMNSGAWHVRQLPYNFVCSVVVQNIRSKNPYVQTYGRKEEDSREEPWNRRFGAHGLLSSRLSIHYDEDICLHAFTTRRLLQFFMINRRTLLFFSFF